MSQLALSQSKRLGIAALLGSLAALAPLSIDMYLPAFPAIAEELAANTSSTQLSLTACLVGLAVGQLVIGPISDSKGRRRPLLIGMLIYAIVSALCMLSSSIWAFIILRFIQGFAGAAGVVISRASVRDLYSGPELLRFMATLMMINGAAPIFAPVVGSELIAWFGWRGVFGTLSVLGLIILFCIYSFLPETLSQDRRTSGGFLQTLKTYRILLQERSFMGYVLTQGFMMAAMFAYISGSSFVFQDIYQLSPRQYSLLFGLNGLGIVAFGQIAGRLAHRVSAKRMLFIGLVYGFVGAVLFFSMIIIQAPLPLVIMGLFFVISSCGLINTTASSLALEEQGKRAGSASALIGMMSFAFGGVVAPLVGLGGSSTAIPMASIMLGMVFGAFLCYLLLTRNRT